MKGPLWTETYAPALDDVPQPQAREHLRGAIEEPMNLLVHGPKGAGKTAGVRALAQEVHENPDADLIEINVADVFDMTKKEISNDPRFSPFIDSKRRRESSKADLINHVLKESASYTPMSGSYKTILLDNAEGMREDFQQALRRVMEQYYEATQFVIATRQPSQLIPPIRSRCFPVVMRAPTHEETVGALERIVEAEGVEYDDDGLEYVAGYADGDLRKAVLGAQTTHEQHGAVTMQNSYESLNEVEADDAVEKMLDAAEEGEFTDARSTLDDLLVDEGHSGSDVLDDILAVSRSRYSGERVARIHALAGEIDADLVEGTSDRIHLSHLLAEIGEIAAGRA
ncbi:replication factor C small subunit [Halomicrobium zhouii]|uniref:Replication factor C small subunit n=1 Tax=Halomicrobium zhouii TaxID=767519 RepID=A0A1I6M6U9_9EURY|nr:AAA family ATPase [Halomicrobium zhouii]SFS11465.1 replication factor C small subunit [Halomicrobium zhouii]